jgi:hypothetical protein
MSLPRHRDQIPLQTNIKLGLALALICAAGMWFYVERVLVPYQVADAAAHDRPRGNLSDLYPRWLGARELLLRHRNPYSKAITREIQMGYYGRALDPARPGDPKDQQGFAYPVYVVLLLAPTVGFPFESVATGFKWLLGIATVASVLLWLRVVRWRLTPGELTIAILLVLGSFSAVQGFKLQQLTLLVAALLAAACALLTLGHRFSSGALVAVATIKPQLTLPLAFVLLLWTLSDWRPRQRFFWGFIIVMLLLVGASEIVLPGWFGNFLSATADYRRYAGGLSMLQVLLSPWVGRVAAGLLVVAVADVCWRFRKQESDQPAFLLMLALTLAATIIIIPMFAPYNFLLMLPAIFLVVKNWRRLWAEDAISRTGLGLFAIALGWPWLVAVALAIASPAISPATLEQQWRLPLYTIAKIPMPLLCMIPLGLLVSNAWKERGGSENRGESREESLPRGHPVA